MPQKGFYSPQTTRNEVVATLFELFFWGCFEWIKVYKLSLCRVYEANKTKFKGADKMHVSLCDLCFLLSDTAVKSRPKDEYFLIFMFSFGLFSYEGRLSLSWYETKKVGRWFRSSHFINLWFSLICSYRWALWSWGKSSCPWLLSRVPGRRLRHGSLIGPWRLR